MSDPEEFAEFEKAGELSTSITLESGIWDGNPSKAAKARLWLGRQHDERDASSSAKRDAREIKTLRIAYAAIAIAVISSAKEIKWLITSFISWLQ